MVPRRARARVFAWVLVFLTAASLCRGQDILLSPKEQASSIDLGDTSYLPGDGFPLGMFRLHPFLRQRGEYDDNVFLEDSSTTQGLFYVATGGLRVDLLPENHEFSLGYKARGYLRLWSTGPEFPDAAERASYDQRVESLDRVEHVVNWRNAMAFPWGRFELTGSWERLNDPLNFTYTRHIRRDVWGAVFRGAVEWTRLRLEGGASVHRYDFGGAFDYLDDLQAQGYLGGGFEITPKMYALLEYAFGVIRYDPLDPATEAAVGSHSDLTFHRLTAGLRGNLTPKLEVLLRAGVTWQILSDPGPGEDDLVTYFGKIRVVWSATDRVNLEINYLRDVQISQLSSYQLVDRGEAKGTLALSPLVTWNVYTYIENTAPSEGDDFLRYGLGTQLEYRMYRWLVTGLGYDYRGRTTDIDGASFTNNRLWGHLTIIF